ncbi:MAG TPA: nuclear transport factor 2 family protein [Vicinamibacterales bacterium]|nr:nuclear transport factor 2 family protein [Vicinamibacterales bacterium]
MLLLVLALMLAIGNRFLYTEAMKAKLLMMTFVMLGALVAAGTATEAAQSKADEKAVTDTLELMARATIAKDVATLEKIYGDEVTYSHSSAATQTKSQVLADINGPNVAEFMKFSETTIRLYGNVAVVKGIVDFRTGPPGALLDNHLNILWVLVRRAPGPHGWQIVARQPTRIGPSTGTPVNK